MKGMWKKNRIIVLLVIMLLCCVALVACSNEVSHQELRAAARLTRMTYRLTDAFDALPYVDNVSIDGDQLHVEVYCDVETIDFGDLTLPTTSLTISESIYSYTNISEPVALTLDEPCSFYARVESGNTILAYDLVILRRHFFDDWTVTVEPTCTEAGSKVHTCSHCDLLADQSIDPLGHDYGSWRVIRPVTCLEESERMRVCGRCGDEDHEITPAPGHDLVHHEGKASCVEPGWAPYDTCKNCDYTTYRELPVSGHTPVIDPACEATCEVDGCSEGSHCEMCGEVLVPQTIYPATGHRFVYSHTIDATCTEDGAVVNVCEVCEKEERRSIPALGHDMVNDVCTRCGYREAKGLEYRKEGGAYYVSSIGSFNGSELFVPDTYNGLSVVGIDAYAFANSQLTSLTLPSSVTSIGENALSGCDSLAELTLPRDLLWDKSRLDRAFVSGATYTITTDYIVNEKGEYISPAIGHGGSAQLHITIEKAGYFEVRYRVSSEQGCDILSAYYNGTVIGAISGEVSEYRTFLLQNASVGDVIDFYYTKDGSVARGNDCGYVFFPYNTDPLASLRELHVLNEDGVCDSTIYYNYNMIACACIGKTTSLTDYEFSAVRDHTVYFKDTVNDWLMLCSAIPTLSGKGDVYFYAEEHGNESNWRYAEDGSFVLGPYGTHTFENEGYTCVARVCSCGYTIPADTEDPVHKYSEWAVETPATCTVNGSETRRCALCGKTESRPIEAHHTPGEWDVVKTATCTESGERIKKCTVCETVLEREILSPEHTFVNGVCTKCCADEASYGPVVGPYTRVNENGVSTNTGKYILFGSYPQTRIADQETISALQSAMGDFTSYGYYSNGSVGTYMRYQDVTYNGEKYRGVLFDEYRSYYTTYPAWSSYSNQDDSGYRTGTIYWFRYEPIKWRILEEKNGEALILAELILDSQEYYSSGSTRTIYGQSVYANNYAESNIRKWLNQTFYETAFSALQQEIILQTTVDNSAESTADTENRIRQYSEYVCADTEDKVFLLSAKEITTAAYGFDSDCMVYDEAKRKQPTEYAIVQGVKTGAIVGSGEYEENGFWLLRSPREYDYNTTGYSLGVDCGGRTIYTFQEVYSTDSGIVPAMRIQLYTMGYGYRHSYGEWQITPATCTQDGVRVRVCTVCGEEEREVIPASHHFENDVCTVCGVKRTTFVRVDAQGAEADDGDYILFGEYPQSLVTDESVVAALNEMAGALPTASDSKKWTVYEYYQNGWNTSHFMWYIDLVSDGERYRGVYFTSYRPVYTTSDGSDGWSCQDDNGYEKYAVYWFLYEPIKWRILEEEDGEALVVAELILDSHEYYSSAQTNFFEHNGGSGYANTYSLSDIRIWLNQTFYETAFNEWQKALILLTTVDNTARTTNPDNNASEWNYGANNYAFGNTEDYIFLLSEQEVTTDAYGFAEDIYTSDPARAKKPSDYAQSQGACVATDQERAGNGRWWLRSPSSSSKTAAFAVTLSGTADSSNNTVRAVDMGVVPALRIRLKAPVYTRVDAVGTEAEDGDYILFGEYPQSLVTDDLIVTALNGLAGARPTVEDGGNWTAYDYYLSDDADYMWYIDRTYEDVRYRGVYFTAYRPVFAYSDHATDNSCQDDNGYYLSTTYWFRYEPIKWRILEEDNGEALILAELILDSREYESKTFDYTFKHNGGMGYANDYMLSDIRVWLNDSFYKTAFSDMQKDIILLSTVENGADSTADAAGRQSKATSYDSVDTEDYVFLLSMREVTTAAYGFDGNNSGADTMRAKKVTDYAKAQGGWADPEEPYHDNGGWWLRSPTATDPQTARMVNDHGDVGNSTTDRSATGIVPALRIRIGASTPKPEPVSAAAFTRVNEQGEEDEIGGYVRFGSYPQSVVTNDSVKRALVAAAGDDPTAEDSKKWTSYGYYDQGNNETDYMWYIDITYNHEQYRGVYFKSFRPDQTTRPATYGDSYQDDNEYMTNTVYWFKYDPILWKIIRAEDDDVLIVSELILDAQEYYPLNTNNEFEHNGGTGYANNYKLSSIRLWLNETFYNTAFNDLQKEIIYNFTVENGARSTNTYDNSVKWNNGVNENACADTEDHVFLLSEEEVTTSWYGYNSDAAAADEARKKTHSEYAKAQGGFVTTAGTGAWWLRSPSSGARIYVFSVNGLGKSEYLGNVASSYCGVVPAMWVNLA